MKSQRTSRNWMIAGAIALALLIGLTTGIGVFVGNKLAQNRAVDSIPPIPQLPLQLHAGTSTRTKSLSMATGQIDERVEGLFLLDHSSGNLQCWILNSRDGKPTGFYTANVKQDLGGAGKTGESDYVMVTGDFFFRGGAGNDVPGRTVCYVGDASSGNVVGYGLEYNQSAITRGTPFKGVLTVLCKGSARGPNGGNTEREQ